MDLTCPHCRHSVEVADGESKKCPNCGQVVRQPKPRVDVPRVPRPVPPPGVANPAAIAATMPKPTDSAAMTSFVCALLFFVPFVTQIVAVIAGLVALLSNRRKTKRVGLAWVGLVLGLVLFAGWAVLVGATSTAIRAGAWTMPAPSTDPEYDEIEKSRSLAREMELVQKAVIAYQRDLRRWPDGVDRLKGPYLANDYKLPERLTFYAPPRVDKTPQEWPLIVSKPLRYDRDGAEQKVSKCMVIRLSGRFEHLSSEDAAKLVEQFMPTATEEAKQVEEPALLEETKPIAEDSE